MRDKPPKTEINVNRCRFNRKLFIACETFGYVPLFDKQEESLHVADIQVLCGNVFKT